MTSAANTLAMINPGAGAGGGLVCIVLLVSLGAGFVHFASTRYFTICFAAGASVFALTLVVWITADVLDPESGDRMYYSMPLLPWSFVLSFACSAIAGLPAVILRAVTAPSERNQSEGDE